MAKTTNPISSAGAKVSVACKLPHGLVLRLFRQIDDAELTANGTRTVRRFEPTGDELTLNGYAVPFGQVPAHKIVGGYALTENVDKDFFDKWKEQHADLPAVRNGLIFAYEKVDDAADRAKEHRDLRSGMEPLIPDRDTRTPKRVARGVVASV